MWLRTSNSRLHITLKYVYSSLKQRFHWIFAYSKVQIARVLWWMFYSLKLTISLELLDVRLSLTTVSPLRHAQNSCVQVSQLCSKFQYSLVHLFCPWCNDNNDTRMLIKTHLEKLWMLSNSYLFPHGIVKNKMRICECGFV